ncbi:MAG: hypothetical protein ABI824_03645, partial [Acidobacteriota bacterium]
QAQRQLDVVHLQQFVKSAVQLKQPDRQVADQVKAFKMTQKLDAATVEDLQSLGAGPQTVAALKTLMTASANLTVAPPVAAASAPPTIPPPSPSEQKAVLDQVRQNALEYTAKLPNFICAQITKRQVDQNGNNTWRLVDTIHEQLSFADRKETYKVVTINNLPVTNMDHDKLGGTTSSGEFGTMLYDIFKPETEAEIKWDRWATLRGRRMHVFEFQVRQVRSDYSIFDGPSGRRTIAAYKGVIYADAETKMVMRIKFDCQGLEDFPITAVSVDMNYDTFDIGGNKYVLPMTASVQSKAGRFGNRNEVQFRLYQKFDTGATIIFDTADEIAPDQLEEKPATPTTGKGK